MFSNSQTQRTLSETAIDDYLLTWMEAFMIDRQAQVARGHATASPGIRPMPTGQRHRGKDLFSCGCSLFRVAKISNNCVH